MGKIISTIVNRFDGGMVDDYRTDSTSSMAVVKHFDIHNYPHKLGPIRAPSAITSGHVIGNIIVGTDGLFYGLGTDDANPTFQKIWNIPDPATPVWTAVANSLSGNVIDYTLFVEYKNYFYTARSGYIMRFDRTGIAASNTTYSAIAYTDIAQGVVHPKDGKLYIPYSTSAGAFIWSLDSHAGTPNTTALTISDTSYKITAITPYGNYLAIAITPIIGSATGSKVLLWDRDSSVVNVSDIIDWGSGILKVLNVLDGYLVGISDVGGSVSNTILDRDSIEIKFYSGGTPQLLTQISTRKQTTSAPDAVINSRVNFLAGRKMYFSLTITGGGASPSLNGLWALGKNSAGKFIYGIERMATTDGSETGVRAAAMIGNYACMVHTADGTTTISTSTSVLANIYTATSVYESKIFNLGDSSAHKKLVGVTVMHEPLSASGSVTMKYRINENINNESAGWITIFTNATLNSLSYDAVNVESTGATLPEYDEIQFQITSTGGASITGYRFNLEIIPNANYD